MEFLKELFGTEALTFDQFAAKVNEHKMKLADISGGAYVGKDKFDTLTIERNTLQARLDEANGKLEGYDPEWKTKAQTAKENADAEIAKVKRGYLVRDSTAGLKFSSEAARKAFIMELEQKNLPVQDEKLLGLDDFVKQYRENDPGAFASEEKPPAFSGPTPGPSGGTAKDQANAAFRAFLSHE